MLLSRHGTLAEQVIRSQRPETLTRPAPRPSRLGRDAEVPLNIPDLEFFNGLGGFADGGREYVTVLGEGLRTPAPWINVIANPEFGFLVSESGSGYTWSGNSHENQLTPWSNDPVTDPPGEAIYIRDEDSGVVWSPTALPVRDEASTYAAWHGQGYSRFRNGSQGILSELLQYVPIQDSIKDLALGSAKPFGPHSSPLGDCVSRNGCWGVRAALRRRTLSRNSMRRRTLYLRAAHGAASSAVELPFSISADGRTHGRATVPSFWGVTDVLRGRRHCKGAARFPEESAPVLIPAPRSRRWWSCVQRNALRSWFSWARAKTAKRRAN